MGLRQQSESRRSLACEKELARPLRCRDQFLLGQQRVSAMGWVSSIRGGERQRGADGNLGRVVID